MHRIPIFRAGTHRSADGREISFTEDDLRAAVDAYDPSLHEAPLVVGHPRDNAPAYGWVKSLDLTDDGTLDAHAAQVAEEFAEAVNSGRFKKRSASFYTPSSPNNPTPGSYYLRHVGFLGAQPPAVKGLGDINLADESEEIIEFVDDGHDNHLLAQIFRRLREWLIETNGTEDADRIIPGFFIEDLEEAGRRKRAEQEAEEARRRNAGVRPLGFNEHANSDNSEDDMGDRDQHTGENGTPSMTPEQLEAERARLEQERREFAERRRALERQALYAEVERFAEAGKVPPAHIDALADFMSALPEGTEEAAVEFGEGDQREQISPRDYMRRFLSALPRHIEYGERAGGESGDGDRNGMTPQDVADRAVEYREAVRARGRQITFTEAVEAVRNGKDQ